MAIGGKPLTDSAWSNPDGRLRIHLPTPLAAAQSVKVKVRYSGKPHVAKHAPRGGGSVLRWLAYDRADPRPGHFSHRYADTSDDVAIVNTVNGRDMSWFFNV